MDFNDVFGGPPRRFSMQEDRMKNRFSGTEESEREGCSNPWRSPKEMPVFGEENMSGRSHSGGDFYDDIFGGNENFTSPRNNYDRESFLGRSPSSKFMSPARLSPIKPEGLGGHAPPIFSLPRKMVTAKDLFYSKSGLSGEYLSRTTSRFSDKAHEQVAMDDESLSYESSVRYQYWSSLVTPDGKDTENLNKERENADYDVEHRFHFSIYKWAGKGVPMLMPVKISSMPATKKPDVSPGSFTKRFQDIYQEVFGKVDDIESPEGIDKTVVFEEMVKPPVLNDIQVKNQKEIPGGIKKTREMSATEIEIPWDADGGQNKKGAERISTRDEVSYRKVEIIDSSQRTESLRRNQSYRWGGILSRQSRNRASTNAPNETGKLSSHYADPTPDYSFEYKEEEQQYPSKTATYTSDNSYFTTTKASPLGMFREGSNVSLENDEDISEVNFVVEVLSDDAPTEALDDPKVIDAKILQWSAGKKGNIHSLLSTLQFVLWPESGWKPIPLVDLLEANSVKKAYQKALLQLHPDKLQQKNAASHQKYIAEKVFDILQEAWDHFNNLEPQ